VCGGGIDRLRTAGKNGFIAVFIRSGLFFVKEPVGLDKKIRFSFVLNPLWLLLPQFNIKE
jgi:hypothetical protein